jgi:hypothetical protein
MKKALAILATVATVAATTVAAPAQARGSAPGWPSVWQPAQSPRGPPQRTDRIMGRAMAITDTALATIMDPGRMPITAVHTIGTAIGAITGNRKARSVASGLFLFSL